MEDPVGFKTSLVLSIAHMRFLEGTSPELEKPSLIHKGAIMRTIRQHLTQFSTNASDFFILVIALLFEVDVSLPLTM
jgi:hypothetical protein